MNKIIPFVAFAALLSGCIEEQSLDNEAQMDKSNSISFTPMVFGLDDNGRASQATKSTIKDFGVSCAIYPASQSYATAQCGSFFFNEKVSASTGRTEYFWPGKKWRLSFYTYTPCDNSNIQIKSSRTDIGIPEYSYTVPSDLSNQADFMTCDILDHIGTSDTPVTLTFNHRCADIRFTVYNQDPTNITLKSIALCGLKYKGVFRENSWSLDSDLNSMTNNPFVLSTTVIIAPDATIDATGSDNHFIALPQTVASGTEIFIVKTIENNKEKTYSYILPTNLNLLAGKSYCFKLMLGNGVITVDPESDIKDWEVEVRYLEINSASATNNFSPAGANYGEVNSVEDWEPAE